MVDPKDFFITPLNKMIRIKEMKWITPLKQDKKW